MRSSNVSVRKWITPLFSTNFQYSQGSFRIPRYCPVRLSREVGRVGESTAWLAVLRCVPEELLISLELPSHLRDLTHFSVVAGLTDLLLEDVSADIPGLLRVGFIHLHESFQVHVVVLRLHYLVDVFDDLRDLLRWHDLRVVHCARFNLIIACDVCLEEQLQVGAANTERRLVVREVVLQRPR